MLDVPCSVNDAMDEDGLGALFLNPGQFEGIEMVVQPAAFQ